MEIKGGPELKAGACGGRMRRNDGEGEGEERRRKKN